VAAKENKIEERSFAALGTTPVPLPFGQLEYKQ